MNRLSAAAALGRGTANLRANRELILIAAGGSVAMAAILIVSVLPWISTLGLDAGWTSGQPDVERLREFLVGLGSPRELVARLGGLVLSVTLALTLASILYCWYLGGILGVLVAGEAQAPPGEGREPALFRTFSMRLFVYESGRLLWRVFLFLNLYMFFWTVLGSFVLVAFAGAGLLGQQSGVGAGCALACGALLPILFVTFALLGAMSLGQADLVRQEGGVLKACAAGFRVLSRRLGAAAFVLTLLVTASVALALATSVLDLVGTFSLSGAAALAFKAIVLVVEMVLGAVVNLAATAAFIALYRDDAARHATPVSA